MMVPFCDRIYMGLFGKPFLALVGVGNLSCLKCTRTEKILQSARCAHMSWGAGYIYASKNSAVWTLRQGARKIFCSTKQSFPQDIVSLWLKSLDLLQSVT